MNRLTLVLPGIEGLAELREGSEPIELDAPAWRKIRTKADFIPGDESAFENVLLREFGVTDVTGGGAAALAVRADLPDIDHAGVWLRADPVYLRADRDHLRFYDAHVLALTLSEAATLAAEIEAIYVDLGWQFHVAAPDRWYLRIDAEPDIRTYVPAEIIGRVVDPHLPQGADAKRWHTLLTEMQMVLHMSEVNAERERAGKLPVNSVWFWGNGAAPELKPDGRTIYADDPLSQALAAALNGEGAHGLDTVDVGAPADGDTYIVDLAMLRPSLYAESEPWREAGATIARRWLEPGIAALGDRVIDELRVFGGQGQTWVLRRAHAWRFWRR